MAAMYFKRMGNYRIFCRVDDVSMFRDTGWAQGIESACLTVPESAEAAVVPVVYEIKGRVP